MTILHCLSRPYLLAFRGWQVPWCPLKLPIYPEVEAERGVKFEILDQQAQVCLSLLQQPVHWTEEVKHMPLLNRMSPQEIPKRLSAYQHTEFLLYMKIIKLLHTSLAYSSTNSLKGIAIYYSQTEERHVLMKSASKSGYPHIQADTILFKNNCCFSMSFLIYRGNYA